MKIDIASRFKLKQTRMIDGRREKTMRRKETIGVGQWLWGRAFLF
jgi:hypothetical protein